MYCWGRRKVAKWSPEGQGGATVGWGVHLITSQLSSSHAKGWVWILPLVNEVIFFPFLFQMTYRCYSGRRGIP